MLNRNLVLNASRLRARRAQTRLTQGDVADALGVSQGHVSKLENAYLLSAFATDELRPVADLLALDDVEWLANGSYPQDPSLFGREVEWRDGPGNSWLHRGTVVAWENGFAIVRVSAGEDQPATTHRLPVCNLRIIPAPVRQAPAPPDPVAELIGEDAATFLRRHGSPWADHTGKVAADLARIGQALADGDPDPFDLAGAVPAPPDPVDAPQAPVRSLALGGGHAWMSIGATTGTVAEARPPRPQGVHLAVRDGGLELSVPGDVSRLVGVVGAELTGNRWEVTIVRNEEPHTVVVDVVEKTPRWLLVRPVDQPQRAVTAWSWDEIRAVSVLTDEE